jgi:hypothetical protein
LFLITFCGCTPPLGNPPLPTGSAAIVTTSGGFGAGGALNLVQLSDDSVTKAIDTSLDQDNFVRVWDGVAYVGNRTPGSLFVYRDTATWKSPVEIPTGDGAVAHATTDPQDLWAEPGTTRLFVSLLLEPSANAVGVLDTAQPQAGVTQWIAVPTAAADSDGKPEVAGLYACDGLLYAVCGDYDETTFAATGPGRIAIIDPKAAATVGFIQLTGSFPSTIAPANGDCHSVLVAESGPLNLEADGGSGVERVDLGQRKSLGWAIRDTELGGRPSSLTIAKSSLAFSTVYFNLQQQAMGGPVLSSAKVVAFDPTTGKHVADATDAAVYIPFAQVTPDGRLFVGVDAYAGSAANPLTTGLYVGPADGSKLPATPIDLGQAPYSIAFK